MYMPWHLKDYKVTSGGYILGYVQACSAAQATVLARQKFNAQYMSVVKVSEVESNDK